MAIFRCNQGILFALISIACVARDGSPAASAAPAVALIQKIQIEHVTPRPDFVGPTPATLE